MSAYISGYTFQPVYDNPARTQVAVEPPVRRQVDLILGPNVTVQQRERAYQLVQTDVNEMGGVGDAGIVEDAIPEYAARLLQENGIPTVADPRVVHAVNSQIGANATPAQRREAYQVMQTYVDEVGGIGDAGIVEEALPWQAGNLLREHGLPARINASVVAAVDSQISPHADFADRMRAYDLVQGYVDDVGGIGDQGIVAEALPGRAGELMRDNRIQTQIGELQPAMDLLERDFAVFDTAHQGDPSQADGKISIDDLEAVRDGGDRFTPEQRSLAVFLLNSPTNRNYLDVGAGKGSVDGTISRGDLDGVRNQQPSGEQYQNLLDTAGGRGGRDGVIGPNDIDAVLADPHAPKELKDALELLRLGGEGAMRDVEGFISRLTPHRLRIASELYNSPQFQALPDADKQLVAQIFRDSGGSPQVMNEVKALLEDKRFTELSAEEKTAVLSQAANYPDSRSIDNLNRLIQKDWFQSFNLEDKQRALKMVAFLSQHDGDEALIGNTLDKFLAPDAPYRMDFDQDGTAYGSALGDQFHLNRVYMPAGNGPVDAGNDDTLHMTTHTFAHEVNHLINGDRVSQTFEYFNAEYRGFYVGFRAQHGRDPTVGEVIERVQSFFRATDGAYGQIALALANGGPESEQIIAFMEQLLGRDDVTAANAATLEPVDLNAPAPPPQGNLENR